ncbi:MAG: nuclear transport factor 2 family protein [Gemmatimonadetes bacterium]|nr:MAG: nuclear transport factor 2 family protein [Gemmatimonadota bacterium]
MFRFLARTRTLSIGVVLLAAAAAMPAPGRGQQAEVEAAVRETLAAWKAGDFEAFATFYHPDARGFFLDGGALLRGFNVAALQAAYNTGFRAELELRELDVAVFGSSAISAALLDGTLTLPSGDVIDGTWRYTETRVTRDGRWQIVQYHFSRFEPLQGG